LLAGCWCAVVRCGVLCGAGVWVRCVCAGAEQYVTEPSTSTLCIASTLEQRKKKEE
jgi:hypothetical protein